MIKVKMFAMLRQYLPTEDADGCWTLDAAGKTVSEVLKQTALSQAPVKYLVMVNNVRVKPDQTLRDGDVITVTPLLAGG